MIPRGKVASPVRVLSCRAITREDLPRLRGPRDKAMSYPKRLRDSHHRVAELLAMGMPLTQIGMLTGYSITRLGVLAAAPAMRELVACKVASKSEMVAVVNDAYAELATRNMLAAERMLSDRISEADDTGDLLPIKDLIAIAADRADRFGYSKRSTQVNVNIDFAARLESAISRAKLVQGSLSSGQKLGTVSVSPPETVPTLLRRIA